MTAITGVGRIGAGLPASAPRGSGGVFQVPARAEAQAAAPTAPVAGLTGLLAMQEADADGRRNQHARRQGQALLQGLAALQRALLGGSDDPEAMRRLEQLASQAVDAADPALAAAVAAVRLRAQVELARRGL